MVVAREQRGKANGQQNYRPDNNFGFDSKPTDEPEFRFR
jgi:hypothetical protein